MSVKLILLIDHDDMVLGLLRGSILGKTPSVTVEIARNKTEAYMRLQLQKYPIIFCDFDILGENEFELYSQILSSQDANSKLIVTCYGDPGELSFDPHPIPGLSLSKPIDQRILAALLSQTLNLESEKKNAEMSLSEAIYKDIGNELKELRRNTNARCIVVSNQDGRVLVQEGDTENMSVDGLATLISGSIITLDEVGHMFNDPTIINLAFREGSKSDLYVMNIGRRLMLILIQDKSMISPKLGTVWFYARQSAIAIDEFINKPSTAKIDRNGVDKADTSVIDELDRLIEK
jgi:predicted regulator of Ras-like GTPase activity (Roadblock/LC7/MglB family)/CheY-like chemotaxis protein